MLKKDVKKGRGTVHIPTLVACAPHARCIRHASRVGRTCRRDRAAQWSVSKIVRLPTQCWGCNVWEWLSLGSVCLVDICEKLQKDVSVSTRGRLPEVCWCIALQNTICPVPPLNWWQPERVQTALPVLSSWKPPKPQGSEARSLPYARCLVGGGHIGVKKVAAH